jgi:hypothetical protein
MEVERAPAPADETKEAAEDRLRIVVEVPKICKNPSIKRC